MAGGTISDEEFHRLQEQLLELKTTIYQKDEQYVKLKNELSSMQASFRSPGPEENGLTTKNKLAAVGNQMLTSLGNKARGMSIDAGGGAGGGMGLTSEEGVLRKLALQEEEFRLQNDTLMEELTRVLAENKILEDQVKLLSQEVRSPSQSVSSDNLALQEQTQQVVEASKIMKEENENLQQRLTESAETIARVKEECDASLSLKESKIANLVSNSETLTTNLHESEARIQALIEENLNLKASNSNVDKITQDLNTMIEINKKTEDRARQLTSENEQKYKEYRRSLDDVTQRKDKEIEAAAHEISNMKNRLKLIDQFEEERSVWAAEKESIDLEMNEVRSERAQFREQCEALQIQIQETHSANDCLSGQVESAKLDVEKMQAQVEEANQAAEKRKSLMDEMAVHLEMVKENHKTAVAALQKDFEDRLKSLEEQLITEKERADSHSNLSVEAESSRLRIGTLETENQSLTEQLFETREKLRETQLACEQQIVSVKQQAQSDLEKLQSEMLEKEKVHECTVRELKQDKEIVMESVARLKQEVKDKTEEKKVIERKWQSKMKDLKKQANAERKRADSLQEKVHSSLESARNSRSPGPCGPEDMVVIPHSRVVSANGDSSSVNSFIMIPSDRCPGSLGGDQDSNSSVTQQIEQDTDELIRKVAQLQADKWEMEERLTLMQQNQVVLTEDLLRKSEVIEQYVKDSTGIKTVMSPSSSAHSGLNDKVRKVVEDVKRLADPAQTDIRDMNRRLQVMLEESLTKNMHLEKDIELLSQEVARLSGANDFIPRPAPVITSVND